LSPELCARYMLHSSSVMSSSFSSASSAFLILIIIIHHHVRFMASPICLVIFIYRPLGSRSSLRVVQWRQKVILIFSIITIPPHHHSSPSSSFSSAPSAFLIRIPHSLYRTIEWYLWAVRPVMHATEKTLAKYWEACRVRVEKHRQLYPGNLTMVPITPPTS
jgi:hypothetical protein